jgi:hypothetical protein
VDALKTLFQQSTAIASQYSKGMMGIAAGFKFFMDQNIAVHTSGLRGGTPLVNVAGQTGTSLVTDGWTATTGAVKKGDIFVLDLVYGANVQNHQSTGSLQQFVVTADTTADGSGNMTIPISPAIIPSGAFQTVTVSPADNAALTFWGNVSTVSPQGLAFHPDAFTLACADLPLPESGVVQAARMSDKQLGMSIRVIRAYDINTDRFPCRLDILYGWAVLRPELAVRIAS